MCYCFHSMFYSTAWNSHTSLKGSSLMSNKHRNRLYLLFMISLFIQNILSNLIQIPNANLNESWTSHRVNCHVKGNDVAHKMSYAGILQMSIQLPTLLNRMKWIWVLIQKVVDFVKSQKVVLFNSHNSNYQMTVAKKVFQFTMKVSSRRDVQYVEPMKYSSKPCTRQPSAFFFFSLCPLLPVIYK